MSFGHARICLLCPTDHYTQAAAAEGDEQTSALVEKQQKLMSNTGFVTFSTLAAKAAGDQIELDGVPNRFDTFAAPEPKDVIWSNVTT